MKKPGPQCEKIRENVSALFDGELANGEADALVERINNCAKEGCPECVQLLKDLQNLKKICDCAGKDCVPPPNMLEELRERIRRRIGGTH